MFEVLLSREKNVVCQSDEQTKAKTNATM